MNKKNIFRSFVLLFTILVIGYQLQAQQTVLDRTIAVVGKDCILLSDLNAQVEFYVFNNHVDPNTPGLQKQVLDVMINDKLIFNKAIEDTNINVSDDEVTNQLDALIQQRIQQAGSEKRLEELYGMPVTKMKREFRDEMRRQIFANKLQQRKFGDMQISRREVEEFFNQFKDSLQRVPEELEVYHIFKIPTLSDEAKKAIRLKAEAILDSIKSGGDFADFALRYSEDLGSAKSGGDLGFARRGTLGKDAQAIERGRPYATTYHRAAGRTGDDSAGLR